MLRTATKQRSTSSGIKRALAAVAATLSLSNLVGCGALRDEQEQCSMPKDFDKTINPELRERLMAAISNRTFRFSLPAEFESQFLGGITHGEFEVREFHPFIQLEDKAIMLVKTKGSLLSVFEDRVSPVNLIIHVSAGSNLDDAFRYDLSSIAQAINNGEISDNCTMLNFLRSFYRIYASVDVFTPDTLQNLRSVLSSNDVQLFVNEPLIITRLNSIGFVSGFSIDVELHSNVGVISIKRSGDFSEHDTSGITIEPTN